MSASDARKWIARITMVSIAVSQSMTAITRIPGNPYGIQVSACAQASSTTARKPGQITGTSRDDGQSASRRVAVQSITDTAAPKSIGHPASAELLTGRVNMRAGYIDWRAARSPSSPKVKTAMK